MFNKLLLITIVLLITTQIAFAQYSASGTYPAYVYQGNASEVQSRKSIYDMRRTEDHFNRISAGSRSGTGYSFLRSRENRKKGLKSIKPREFEKEHKQFLKQSDTGVFRLLAKNNCTETGIDNLIGDDREINKMIKNCPNYFIIGGGNYYSFRTDDYTGSRRADLGISDDWLFSFGLLNQGLFVELGDVEIDTLNASSVGLDYLFEYVPETDIKLADRQRENLEMGIVNGKYTYRGAIQFKENTSYGLRVVAYDNDVLQTVNILNGGQMTVNMLENDKRKDIIIVFRVLEKATNGSVVLLWKQLQIKDAPKMNVPE